MDLSAFQVNAKIITFYPIEMEMVLCIIMVNNALDRERKLHQKLMIVIKNRHFFVWGYYNQLNMNVENWNSLLKYFGIK